MCDWIERISESDQEAFDSLFRFLYPQLVQFGMRYTRNRAVASDIAQDAFVVLWNKRQELDRDFLVKAYLYRVVRNDSLNYIRDHGSRTVGLEEMDSDLEEKQEYADSSMEQNEDSGLQMSLLKKWIKELPERRREAFELSRFEGLDHEEISDVMDISPNTVNNHIVAALDYLKDRYHEHRDKVNNKI